MLVRSTLACGDINQYCTISPMGLLKQSITVRRFLVEDNFETYTYTARNVSDPDRVVTFTLFNNHMRVSLADVFEKASRVAQAEEKPTEIGRQLATEAVPATMKLVESISGPAHVYDVDAQLEDQRLKLIVWQRVAGLRLSPIQFNMGKIDNPTAAQAFLNKLNQRKEVAPSAGRFLGPLDYWLGWAGLLLLIGALLRWPRRRKEATA